MRTVVLCFSLILSLALSAQPQTVGLFDINQAWDGYTMISTNTTENVYLIDNCGEVVHSWATESRPGLMSYLDKDGNLIRTERVNTSFGSGGAGGRITKYSWEGEVLWQYDLSNDLELQHHDIAVLENGNILVLAWDRRTKEEAIALGRPSDNVGDYLWSEKIVELRPDGLTNASVVWEWKLWDHLIQDLDPALPNYGYVSSHPERLNINFSGTQAPPLSGQSDWIHFNAIDYNPELDQIVLSSRHLSEFFIIDHSTTTLEAAGSTGGNAGMGGDILYRWGNGLGYKLAEESSKQLFGPHNPTWIKHGDEQDWAILIFNNGVGRPGPDYSQVDIIPLPITDFTYSREPNLPYGPSSAAWTIDSFQNEEFYSSNISGAQLLPNGNVMVCVGQGGEIFEVDTATQTKRWYYINPEQSTGPTSQGVLPTTNNLFRANRYAKDFIGFSDKELTPMGPIELNPFPAFCFNPNSVEEIVLERSDIFPNPTNGILTINGWNIDSEISVFDQVGSLKIQQKLAADRSLDLSELSNGIYFVKTPGAVAQRVVLLR